MKDWNGGIITEGLSEPTIVNGLSAYEGMISRDNMPIDREGHVKRWQGYVVMCSREEEEIAPLQPHISKMSFHCPT